MEDQKPQDHLAWDEFLANYSSASEADATEYLTTGNVLELLNDIIFDEFYTDQKLFYSLKTAGFKQIAPSPSSLFLWMLKPKV